MCGPVVEVAVLRRCWNLMVVRYWAQQQALGQAPGQAQLPPQMMVQGCEWSSWNSLQHASQFEEFWHWRWYLLLLWPVVFLMQMQDWVPLSCRPVFIDVLVHQEITVCIFCEFPGSGSWVVRVVAPWGKLNTTIWSRLIRKRTTLYYHVLYIYMYTYIFTYIIHYVYQCVVSSCCFVVAVAETVVPEKATAIVSGEIPTVPSSACHHRRR